MSNYTEDELYDMDDDALEAAFKSAKADNNSSEINTEEFVSVDDTSTDNDVNDSENLDDTQDSDQNGTEADEGVEAEDDSNQPEDSLDGDVEGGSEQTSNDKANLDTTVQPGHKRKVRAAGKDYEFTDEEIVTQFPKVFGQAMDYTRKMQAIKPWRKTIDAIDSAKLSHDDVSLMIDVLKGDKEAIAAVLKRTGVDTLDLDTENSNYVPKSYGRDERTLAIKDVVDTIIDDPEYAVTHKIVNSQWDDASWAEMTKNPTLIEALHIDVKNGNFAKVQPMAEKLKLYDGGRKSDMDYYIAAGAEYHKEQDRLKAYARQQEMEKAGMLANAKKTEHVVEVKQKTEQRKTTEQAAIKRKAAAPTKPGPSKAQGIKDYLEDSDEFDQAFEEWHENLKRKM